MAEVLPLDIQKPDRQVVERACRFLLSGGVLAGPSDTVYGFLADPASAKAMGVLRSLKQREGPFLHLASSLEVVERLCDPMDPRLREGLESLWPGPVTVVLPVSGQESGNAYRVPQCPWLLSLLGAVGGPLVSTSANPKGEPEPQSAVEVVSWFPDLPLVIDGGPAASARPSTLIDGREWPIRVLRSGAGDVTSLLDHP